MKKPKIAISLDKGILDIVDSKVDGNVLRSRSQAVEFFLRKGLHDQFVDTAVILLKGEHQGISLKKVKGKTLIASQLEFFEKNNIRNVLIVTQHTKEMSGFLNEIAGSNLNVEVFEKNVKGTADALSAVKERLKASFLVMSGDTYNNFELMRMLNKHSDLDKLATMGLMTRPDTSRYGTAILDGDLVVDFHEKPRQGSTNIVNAGIYVFKHEIFELFTGVNSLERDLFPKLARMKQLTGFFTYGEYLHIE